MQNDDEGEAASRPKERIKMDVRAITVSCRLFCTWHTHTSHPPTAHTSHHSHAQSFHDSHALQMLKKEIVENVSREHQVMHHMSIINIIMKSAKGSLFSRVTCSNSPRNTQLTKNTTSCMCFLVFSQTVRYIYDKSVSFSLIVFSFKEASKNLDNPQAGAQ